MFANPILPHLYLKVNFPVGRNHAYFLAIGKELGSSVKVRSFSRKRPMGIYLLIALVKI